MNTAEVARRAGVSLSTVSYVLSGNRPVCAQTRARVRQVTDELDYRPNATARALANGRTGSLGLGLDGFASATAASTGPAPS
ncbi:LacI family DNA-binding transcriptional regulator [Actinospica sp. MGRD01-02]|uniref:LacI family DNA-binding transcriptional regulator n=1 Tax=Actinospica acidithermotolerans TaxID=2828514 RepID=A0A941ILM0_9ACTN|nr:LacI family DNA-binding transcriptional regulator [Actinospica acidithermotolerans]MBR7829198.1 LacI family DNA-binding transcriptional regulator [Actinospica acidithermotolerans]